MQKTLNKKKNTQITGLRAVMIIMIVVYHLTARFQQIYTESDVPFVKYWGGFGVIVFLLISSYYATDLSISHLPKRILRLWPAYVVSITITMLCLHFFPLEGRTCSLGDFVFNVFFINGFLNIPYVDGAHWYLTTLLASLVVISFINLLDKRYTVYGFALWIFVSLLIKIMKLTLLSYFFACSYCGIVCISISLNKLINKRYKDSKERNRWIILAVIALVASGYLIGVVKFIKIIIAVPLFLCAINKKLSFLENRFLQFVGMISYPLYLIHQNIAFIIEHYLLKKSGRFYLWHSLVAFVVVFIMAYFIYVLVEKPFQNWINKKSKAIENK